VPVRAHGHCNRVTLLFRNEVWWGKEAPGGEKKACAGGDAGYAP